MKIFFICISIPLLCVNKTKAETVTAQRFVYKLQFVCILSLADDVSGSSIMAAESCEEMSGNGVPEESSGRFISEFPA